ncbi:hypothetical protein GCM10008019_40320 [Deinococcus soli (ex Cha et al. 2016)]|nr:hypothetical protein GCM10008019_40320 [Deinococcus soli (ex Cha et al. 2016)]
MRQQPARLITPLRSLHHRPLAPQGSDPMKNILNLQTLRTTAPAPTDWSTISNHCGSNQLA